MPKIELVYFEGCPNVGQARTNLRDALGAEDAWVEWDLDDEATPSRVRGFASPAVLVEGRHVLGDEPGPANSRSCSVVGAPTREAIALAIRGAG